MGFKVFDAYGAAARPEATLRASGQLFLSRGILRRSEREDWTLYQLQFDEDTDRLAIRMYRKNDGANGRGVREASQERSGIAINLVPLLRYYNIQMPKSKVMLPVSFEDGLMILDLKELRDTPAPTKGQDGDREVDFDDDIPF